MTMYRVPRVLFFWQRAITIWWPWRREPRVYVPASYVGRNDLGVVEAHEAVHVKQWKRLGRFGFLREYITKAGRLDLEAEAFAASVKYWESLGVTMATGKLTMVDAYAKALSEHYGGLPEAQARTSILRWLA